MSIDFISIFSIFPTNKYLKWHHAIINKALSENREKDQEIYYEAHHIWPKCFGGSNDQDNLVLLTAKEHYIVHLLLVFITKKNKRKHYQMVHALQCFSMCHYHERYVIPSNMIIHIRKMLSETRKGVPILKQHGKIVSESTKQKMKENHWTTKGFSHGMLGKSHSNESKNKMRENSSKYSWIITSPSNQKFETKAIRHFAEIHNLNIDAIIRFQNRGPVPKVSDRVVNQTKEQRLNTIGWSFNSYLISS